MNRTNGTLIATILSTGINSGATKYLVPSGTYLNIGIKQIISSFSFLETHFWSLQVYTLIMM